MNDDYENITVNALEDMTDQQLIEIGQRDSVSNSCTNIEYVLAGRLQGHQPIEARNKPFMDQVMINGYEVYLRGYYDCPDDWRTECHVIRGEYSASLECLDGEGILTHTNGFETYRVPQRIIDRCATWAHDRGY